MLSDGLTGGWLKTSLTGRSLYGRLATDSTHRATISHQPCRNVGQQLSLHPISNKLDYAMNGCYNLFNIKKKTRYC